jgi:16S rRNA (guanine527-N7)-methyltransferase
MSESMSEVEETAGERLNALLVQAGFDPLDPQLASRFESYLSLILRWNARMNLTAIRDEGGILSRHFVESIACARALPAGITTLLDFGSGAGFPGIPIALCRPEIAVTLAESNGKKAAFLQEAIRNLDITAKVHSKRAESLPNPYDCVTLRAVDRMEQAVRTARGLVRPGGWLALMTTRSQVASLQDAAGDSFSWPEVATLADSDDLVLMIGSRSRE